MRFVCEAHLVQLVLLLKERFNVRGKRFVRATVRGYGQIVRLLGNGQRSNDDAQCHKMTGYHAGGGTLLEQRRN